jgi:hypothetical protein
MEKELLKKLDWLIIHLRVTQALCEIIIENLPEKDKKELISLMHDRVKQID